MRDMVITLRYRVEDEVAVHQGVHVAQSLAALSEEQVSGLFSLRAAEVDLYEDDDPVSRVLGHIDVRPATTFRRFVLNRKEDATGNTGEGIVAEGVEFSNGIVALQWTSEFPTSVVFHTRGMESVEAVHGHGGKTAIEFLD